MYVTPKQQQGEVSQDFKIIWVEGDLPRATTLSAQVATCAGLVKGRISGGYGLRFRTADFLDAWNTLLPHKPAPTLPQGNITYKIEGLPFGCSQQMLQDWADTQKWPITPFRTLGPQCWMVKASQNPPSGIVMFNSSPVLISLVKPKPHNQGKILTGPMPKQGPKDVTPTAIDPWANWTGPRLQPSTTPSTATRVVDGPTELRFKAQDDQIQQLKADIKQLANDQTVAHQSTEQKFQQAEKNAAKHAQDVQQAMGQLRQDIDKTLKVSIQQQSSMVESRFQEIKDLFLQQRNKRRSPEGEEMED